MKDSETRGTLIPIARQYMNHKTIILLFTLILLSIISHGQPSDNNLIGKFVFSLANNGSTIEINNNKTYTLTTTSCLSNCTQHGKWVVSSDTIRLQEPTNTKGNDDCLLYYQIYSTLVLKDNKLFIINTDSTNKDKLFYVKEKLDKTTRH